MNWKVGQTMHPKDNGIWNFNDTPMVDANSTPPMGTWKLPLEKQINICPKKTTTCIISFQMAQNPQRIDLPRSLDNIRSIRTKQISWLVRPLDPTATMLYLSCPDLLKDSPQQSCIFTLQPSVASSNQLIQQRSLIAAWSCAPEYANTLNYQNEAEQSKMNLPKPISINKLSFNLETELGPVVVNSTHKLSVTLEFEVEI